MSSDTSSSDNDVSPRKKGPRKPLATRRRMPPTQVAIAGVGTGELGCPVRALPRTAVYTNRVYNMMHQAPKTILKLPEFGSSSSSRDDDNKLMTTSDDSNSCSDENIVKKSLKLNNENCPRCNSKRAMNMRKRIETTSTPPCTCQFESSPVEVIPDTDVQPFARSPSPPQLTLNDVLPNLRNKRRRKKTKAEKKTASLLRNVDMMLTIYKMDNMVNENYLNDSNISLSPSRPSTSSKLVTVKVRRGLNVMRFSMKSNASFAVLSKLVSEHLTVNCESIMFTLHDNVLNMADTPECVGLTIVDILECLIVEPEAISKTISIGENAKRPGLIHVKFQGCAASGKDAVQLRINKKCELGEAFSSYCLKQGVKEGTVKFMFDGDALSPDDTPDNVDIEDDDIIDVVKIIS